MTDKVLIALLFCLTLFVPTTAHAQDEAYQQTDASEDQADPLEGVDPANILTLENGERIDCTDGGMTTYAMNRCAGAELELLKQTMQLYWASARQRFIETNLETEYNRDSAEEKAAALAIFDRAQEDWESYRTNHCLSVYYEYKDGTIRGVMALSCHREMVRKRTWEIWSTWLTYMDSTAPILPEPDFGYYPGRDYGEQ